MKRKTKEAFFFLLFRFSAMLVVASLTIIIGFVVINGVGKLSIDFLTQNPMPNNHGALVAGGILSPIIGTMMLMGLVLLISIPIGVLSSIFLVEFLGSSRIARIWWIVVDNLAGVPSIVWGLLGLALFVYYLHFGLSLIAAGITLSLLVLPLIMVATKQAIEAVPSSIREASISMGATRLQTIRHHVLPYSASGIMTGIILSMSRAAGETAPLLIVGVAVNASIPASLTDQFQAIPAYIYFTWQSSDFVQGYKMAYAAALVLIALIIGMNLTAILLRNHYRNKYRW